MMFVGFSLSGRYAYKNRVDFVLRYWTWPLFVEEVDMHQKTS